MTDLVPDDYTATLEDLKRQVHDARYQAQRRVNTELLMLWWRIGRTILDRQQEQGWGTRLDDQELRDWYAAKAAHHGWTRATLTHQLATRLHEREAAAPTNFAGALERVDSELAQEITKDPYAL
ncbi:unnamed protein product, partial [Penicillium discolor]